MSLARNHPLAQTRTSPIVLVLILSEAVLVLEDRIEDDDEDDDDLGALPAPS